RRRTFVRSYGRLSGRPASGSGGDPDGGGGRAAFPDQPLQLVDVDPRDREERRLAQLVPERDQPLGPPAQDGEVVVEPAPLASEGVELVHWSAASVAAAARAHRPREGGPGCVGEGRAGDLELDARALRMDSCHLAVSDPQLPAGEIEQLEQE